MEKKPSSYFCNPPLIPTVNQQQYNQDHSTGNRKQCTMLMYLGSPMDPHGGNIDEYNAEEKRNDYRSFFMCDENFECITDDLGCEAIQSKVISDTNTVIPHSFLPSSSITTETRTSSSSTPTSNFIRLQSQLDPCLHDIHTQEDVLNKIYQVKEFQKIESYNLDVEPYHREWKDVEPYQDASEEDFSVHTKIHDSKVTSYPLYFMQFNMLAEGLSSGPHVIPSFSIFDSSTTLQHHHQQLQEHPQGEQQEGSMRSKNSNHEDGSLIKNSFGGFHQVPFPHLVFEFALRRWRLMEILLGLDHPNQSYEKQQQEMESERERKKNTQCIGLDPIERGSVGLYDIIGLQEVDRFHGFFRPILSLFGYRGIFAPKIQAPGIKLGFYSDGCALFWKEKELQLLSSFMGKYKVGNQVYLVATLRHVKSGRVIVVAVTHLKAKEGASNEAIRLLQVQQLRDSVEEMAKEATIRWSLQNEDCYVPTFILGDFNSEPNVNDRGRIKCVDALIHPSRSQRSHLDFSSAYSIDPVPSYFYTTWKIREGKAVRRVIDYILHNSISIPGIRIKQILLPPKEEDMDPSRLPGLKYPSDHMALVAKFLLDPIN